MASRDFSGGEAAFFPAGGLRLIRRIGALSMSVSHKVVDLELDSLTNWKPEFLIKEDRDRPTCMGELWDAPYKKGSSTENGLKFRCVS